METIFGTIAIGGLHTINCLLTTNFNVKHFVGFNYFQAMELQIMSSFGIKFHTVHDFGDKISLYPEEQ